MENRIAKLKLDDNTNEDIKKEKSSEIEQESVSKLLFVYFGYKY